MSNRSLLTVFLAVFTGLFGGCADTSTGGASATCATDADCDQGEVCDSVERRCVAETDGSNNFGAGGLDLGDGGPNGPGDATNAPDGAPRLDASIAALCGDGERSGNETDVDCGGECLPCADELACVRGQDCVSGVCFNNACRAPQCDDGVQNADETGVDCGGGCPACEAGAPCSGASDCVSGVCTDGVCAPAGRADEVSNGAESDVDCGGDCAPCDVGRACGGPADCASGVCPDGRCATPRCGDGVVHAGEFCDDGDEIDENDCTNSCTVAICGDGVVHAENESCDDRNQVTEECEYGVEACTVCAADCTERPG